MRQMISIPLLIPILPSRVKPMLIFFVKMSNSFKKKFIMNPIFSTILWKSLQKYYLQVKTRCRLTLDVPAGFCQSNDFQKNFLNVPHQKKTRAASESISFDLLDASLDSTTISNDHSTISNDGKPTSDTNDCSTVTVPILWYVDKPSSSLPSVLTLTQRIIHSCVAFRRINTIKQHLQTLYHDTVSVDLSPTNTVFGMRSSHYREKFKEYYCNL